MLAGGVAHETSPERRRGIEKRAVCGQNSREKKEERVGTTALLSLSTGGRREERFVVIVKLFTVDLFTFELFTVDFFFGAPLISNRCLQVVLKLFEV